MSERRVLETLKLHRTTMRYLDTVTGYQMQLHDDLMIRYSEGGSNRGRVVNQADSWAIFRKKFEKPTRSGETCKQFDKMSNDEQHELKAINGYIMGAPMRDGVRRRANIKPRDMITYDFDHMDEAFVDRLKLGALPISDKEFFVHTTRRHRPDAPRIRMFFPCSRSVSADEYGPLSRIIAFIMEDSKNPMPLVDEVSFRPAQIMYKPTASKDGIYWSYHNEGDLIDPDEVFAWFREHHGDPQDYSILPRTIQEGDLRRAADKAEDPTTKRGPVGDWCRAYDVIEVIDKFLSDRYAPADDYSAKPRYTYLLGTSSSGAVVEDGGLFLYSHHGSDPCAEMLVNSFDLVRIHLFGDKDKGIDPKDTPPNKMPSYKAMVEFAQLDEGYRYTQAASRHAITDLFEDMVEEAKSNDEYTDQDVARERSEEEGGTSDGGLTMLTPDECAVAASARYVVKGLIEERNVASIVGAPGVGKSVLVPRLAYAVAQGEAIFGMRVRQGKVFYVAAENERDMKRRVRALRDRYANAADFRLILNGGGNMKKGSVFLKRLRAVVSKERPSLIVIDTLAAAMPGFEENSSEGMGGAIAVARSLTNWGAAVIVVHHDTKAGDGLPRGHSSLHGIVDVNLALRRDDDGTVRGKCSKNRNGESHVEILTYRNEIVVLGTDDDGDEERTVICSEISASAARERKEHLTPSAKAAFDAFHELIDGRDAVPEQDWRKVCVDGRAVSASEKADSRAKTFKRAAEELTRKGKIVFREGYYFPTIIAAAPTEFPDMDEDESTDSTF